MKRTLGIMMLVAAVGAVQAQDPTPPARPVRPAEPARPAPAARIYGPITPRPFDIDEVRVRAEADRAAREFEREWSRVDLDAVREQSARVADER